VPGEEIGLLGEMRRYDGIFIREEESKHVKKRNNLYAEKRSARNDLLL
jgi:hypothetical protein